jgi:hypothetical protein
MDTYGIEECEVCEYGMRFPQGMYCCRLHKYLVDNEVYSKSCGNFLSNKALNPGDSTKD